MRYSTPLRYPGGKSRLANFIKLVFDHNDIVDGHYAEPYAGGASVALSLLFHEYACEVHVNDVDPAVYAFWHSVLRAPDDLCELIRRTPVTMAEWHKQKGVQQAGRVSMLRLGFSTFFLNRTNRSGIIHSGGAIGGTKQRGEWKLDARYNRDELIVRIQRIASFRDRIHLTNHDAVEFLRQTVRRLPHRTLAYLDPPYFVKGQRLYANYYRPSDHAEVARVVNGLRQKWIVSYDCAPEIIALYSKRRRITYDLSYSAMDRYRGKEVMFFSPGLVVPKIANPSLVTPRFIRESSKRAQIALELV